MHASSIAGYPFRQLQAVMAYGGSGFQSQTQLDHDAGYDIASIPSPTPKIAYEAPSFRTFQDRKKSRLLAHEGYQPPRRSQTLVEDVMSSVSSLTPSAFSQTCTLYPASHTVPTASDTDAEALRRSELQHPSPIPARRPLTDIFVSRSDTLSSVRSLDSCTSPTKRPLPRPPTAVSPSRSLDRGVSGRNPTGHATPVFVLDSPPVEASDASGSNPMITSSANTGSPVSPPLIVVMGDMETQPEPRSNLLPSSQPSPSSQGGMSYSHPPVITVSTLDQTPYRSNKIDTATTGDSAPIICAGCDSAIIGRTVNAMSQHFHPECFRCAECGERLEHVSSYEWEGRAFCHLDYHDKFAPRCHHCCTPIVEPRFITLDDQVLGQRFYHELHFFCCECGDPFLHPSESSSAGAEGAAEETSAFVIHKGHPYCERCHLRLHKPKCRACKSPIADAALKALESHWHLECFTCSHCAQPFPNGLYFPIDSRALCRRCYDEF